MLRRAVLGTLALSLVGGELAWAGHGPFRTWLRNMSRDAQRNNAWPDAFIPPDRAAVRDAFAVNVDNGWRLQNTLSDFHFDENGQLTEAGALKVQSIVQENPAERRTVFVLQADQPEMSAARLASTQEVAARYMLGGELPQVATTHKRPIGWPANFVVLVDRARSEAMPPPILPPRAQGSGGGASASGS